MKSAFLQKKGESMRIIQENMDGAMYHSRILGEYLDFRRTVVADIETTGLSPRNAKVILGGLVVPDGEGRLALQYFADRPEDEEELLDRYVGMLAEYDTIVTYNGNTFDLPFLKKRMKTHGLSTEMLEACYSFDLYRVIRRYSGLSSILPDLKQKTVEMYMGFGQARTDTIDGAESVRLYYQYLKSSGPRQRDLLDRILLHNRDDIVKLSDILEVLRQLDIHEIMYNEGFPVRVDGNRKAVIRGILVNSRGMTVEGIVPGRPEPYRSFSGGVDAEIDEQRRFFLRVRTEDVEGYRVADLRSIDADSRELQELPGYESGYLILRGLEKQVLFHEANMLAKQLTGRLLQKQPAVT